MSAEALYYVWAVLLLVANLAAWVSNFFTLPGNWIIVALTAVFAFFLPDQDGPGLGWTIVAVVAVLAVLGEVFEFVAGAAGAAKQGASRRAMVLSAVGAIVGSIGGSIAGSFIPIPVVGTIVGALGGGAFGAFGGAYLGEVWKGKSSDQSLQIGKAALAGRLLGTVGKLCVGAVMLLVVTMASFF